MNNAQQTEINMDTQRGRRVTIYLEPSIADQLQEWCETEERTMTYAIGKALGMWLKGKVCEPPKPCATRPARRSPRVGEAELASIILGMLEGGPCKMSDIVLAAIDRGYSESQTERVRNELRKKRRVGVYRVAHGSRWFLTKNGPPAKDSTPKAKRRKEDPIYMRVQRVAASRDPMALSDCYSLGEFISTSRIVEKNMIQKYITRNDDPLPFVPISDRMGAQKYGFPRAETDAWLERNGYRGAK